MSPSEVESSFFLSRYIFHMHIDEILKFRISRTLIGMQQRIFVNEVPDEFFGYLNFRFSIFYILEYLELLVSYLIS